MKCPLLPERSDDVARWEHSARRRRMLEGTWSEDAAERLLEQLGRNRGTYIGRVDLTTSVLTQTATQLAVLYSREPSWRHEDTTAAAVMRGLLRGMRYTPTMRRVQRYTLAQRQALVRVHASPTEGGVQLVLRQVFPDLVDALPSSADPAIPGRILEAREVKRGGQLTWLWEEHDVRNPGAPVHRWLDAQHLDVSAEVDGYVPGYFWIDSTGKAVLPYVLYHAEPGPHLWDPFAWQELYDGSLNAAVLFTHFAHSVRNAGWPQRWVLNAEVAGGVDVGDGAITSPMQQAARGSPRREVVADPTSVVELTSTGDSTQQAQVGQWQPGAQPDQLFEAVSKYERRVASVVGLSSADFVRMSGDPRSGYALAISREGQREAAQVYGPTMAEGDAQLARLVAIGANRGLRLGLPEDGYRVVYTALPRTEAELAARQARVIALLDKGLITAEQAQAALDEDSVDGVDIHAA